MKRPKRTLPDEPVRGSADVPERLRALDRSQLHAVLSTAAGVEPYSSLVAFALTPDSRGLVFATPKASRKYRNILANENVSLLIDTRSNAAPDYLRAEALTVEGTARPVRRGRRREELSRLLAEKHPTLSDFLLSEGTSLILVDIKRCSHVTGFKHVTRWEREARG